MEADETGTKPLANAAKHVTTTAYGKLISVKLTGVEVFHHKGLGDQPRRQIIPDAVTVPPSIHDALEKASKQAFEELTRQ